MSGTALTAMTALEPLTTNLAAYTYTTMVSGLTFKINDESSSWDTWTTQVADTTAYTVSEYDTTNAEKFSSFFISHEVTTGGAEDDGVCFISSVWGTVCLIEQSSVIETYRVSTSQWDTAVAAFSSTEEDIITSIESNTGAWQDDTGSATEWFDKYYCSGSTPTFVCSAW